MEITSALGWMHKTSFEGINSESHDTVDLWPGWTLITNKTSLYLKHIEWVENTIADFLLRDFYILDQIPQNIFNHTLSTQTAA